MEDPNTVLSPISFDNFLTLRADSNEGKKSIPKCIFPRLFPTLPTLPPLSVPTFSPIFFPPKNVTFEYIFIYSPLFHFSPRIFKCFCTGVLFFVVVLTPLLLLLLLGLTLLLLVGRG